MKKLISTLLLTITILIGYGQEPGKNLMDQNYIEVTGKSKMEIAPDEIFIKLLQIVL